jgi:hypothetical protein
MVTVKGSISLKMVILVSVTDSLEGEEMVLFGLKQAEPKRARKRPNTKQDIVFAVFIKTPYIPARIADSPVIDVNIIPKNVCRVSNGHWLSAETEGSSYKIFLNNAPP